MFDLHVIQRHSPDNYTLVLMPDTYSCRNVSAQNCVCKNGVFSVKHQPVEPSTPHPPAGSHPIPRKKTFNLYVDQSVSMKANIPWNHAKRKLFVKTTVFLKKFLNYKTDRNRALHLAPQRWYSSWLGTSFLLVYIIDRSNY